jgi:hypothetical protein
MTEAELLREVLRLASEYGVLAHHCGDSRLCQGDAGMPDVFLVGSEHVMWAELKSDTGGTTPDQTTFKWRLLSCGQHRALWRPSHLHDGTVDAAMAWLHSREGTHMPRKVRESIYT